MVSIRPPHCCAELYFLCNWSMIYCGMAVPARLQCNVLALARFLSLPPPRECSRSGSLGPRHKRRCASPNTRFHASPSIPFRCRSLRFQNFGYDGQVVSFDFQARGKISSLSPSIPSPSLSQRGWNPSPSHLRLDSRLCCSPPCPWLSSFVSPPSQLQHQAGQGCCGVVGPFCRSQGRGSPRVRGRDQGAQVQPRPHCGH